MNKEIIDEETKVVKKSKKERLDEQLNKVNNLKKAIDVHSKVKKAADKEEVDYNYLRYVEGYLEEKFLGDIDIKDIMPKVLLEIVYPELVDVESFDPNKLQIENIGSHFEEQENYIDKICVYDNKLVSVFGISEMHPSKFIKHEPRKFSRVDMIQAIEAKYKEGQTISLFQFDEYYVCIESERIKVFSKRKVTALAKIQETIFDKIKEKIASLFTRKNLYPKLELVFDSNPNRLKEFKHKKSKIEAKSRMKTLLSKERELTREQL